MLDGAMASLALSINSSCDHYGDCKRITTVLSEYIPPFSVLWQWCIALAETLVQNHP